MTRRAIDRGTNHQPRHDYSLLAVLAALGPLGPRGYPEPLLGYGAYLLFEVYADADETATATAANDGGDGDDDARGDAGRASAVTAPPYGPATSPASRARGCTPMGSSLAPAATRWCASGTSRA